MQEDARHRLLALTARGLNVLLSDPGNRAASQRSCKSMELMWRWRQVSEILRRGRPDDLRGESCVPFASVGPDRFPAHCFAMRATAGFACGAWQFALSMAEVTFKA
jgi:hypothetical protein